MEASSYAPPPQPVSPWAISGVIFAATMMVMIGIFQAISGLVAIIDDEVTFYVVPTGYTFDYSVTTWGWIHLIMGILVFLAGISLFSGNTWAAVVAIFIAMLSAITNFFWIPYYPFWSILVIALDVFVIWSLAKVASATGS
jgi:hypothetical protein